MTTRRSRNCGWRAWWDRGNLEFRKAELHRLLARVSARYAVLDASLRLEACPDVLISRVDCKYRLMPGWRHVEMAPRHARRTAARIGRWTAAVRRTILRIALVSCRRRHIFRERRERGHWIKGMNRHKFSVGDRVDFIPAFYRRVATAMEFEIVRQLPALNGEFFYRIKSAQEPHERVVGESQLRHRELDVAPPPTAPPRSTTKARQSGTASRPKSKAKAARSAE